MFSPVVRPLARPFGTLALVLACALAASVPAAARAQLTYTEVAREGGVPVGWVDGTVAPALADDGTVLFSAESQTGVDGLYASDGSGAAVGFDLPTSLTEVLDVGIDSLGNVVFRAKAGPADSNGPLIGVYSSHITRGAVTTIHEGRPGHFDPDPLSPRGLEMAEGGMYAFGTLANANGAIYRGVVGQPPEVLRAGSGDFFNIQAFDVNSAGTVAVQMEHVDPFHRLLRRGILVFDEPGLSTTEVDTAVERLPVSRKATPAINEAGDVAFYTNDTLTLRYYDPPFDATGTLLEEIVLEPGVYVTTPTPMGQPNTFTQIANTAGGYDEFSEVDINDHGTVVFRASLDAGRDGIFSGPDPELDAVLLFGEELADTGTFTSYFVMGELNENDELSVLTSDYHTANYILWRIGGIATCRALCRALRGRVADRQLRVPERVLREVWPRLRVPRL